MNFPSLALGLLTLIGPLAASGTAQLVHVSFAITDTSFIQFDATDGSIPWGGAHGTVTQLDLYYDAQAHYDIVDDGWGQGTLDPSRNFWHIRVETPDEPALGDFDITRPFDSVTVFENSLLFDYHGLISAGYQLTELEMDFGSPIPVDGKLPLPPLPPLALGYNHFFVDGGESIFQLPGLGEAFGSVGFSSFTTEITAIPESSGFAAGALVLVSLGVIIARRRNGGRCAGTAGAVADGGDNWKPAE